MLVLDGRLGVAITGLRATLLSWLDKHLQVLLKRRLINHPGMRLRDLTFAID